MVTGKILQTITSPTPWMIHNASYLHSLMTQIRQGRVNGQVFSDPHEIEEPSGSVEGVQYLGNGIAVIPVKGIFMTGESEWYWGYMGMFSVHELAMTVNKVKNDPEVTSVIFEIDSPGGVAKGIKELSDLVFSMRESKETIAYVASLACSCGYYLAAACEHVIAAPSAEVGNIGIRVTLYKYNDAIKESGYDVHLFAKGDLKAAGAPERAIDDKEIALFEEMIDKGYEQFTSDIARYRGVSQEVVKATESKWYDGSEAPAWMVDRVMDLISFQQEVLNAVS